MDIREKLTERFLRYVSVPSQSDASNDAVPSTPGQLKLAQMLMNELEEMGLIDIYLSEKGVLTAHLPAKDGLGDCPAIGWIVHLDTADIGASPEVRPLIVRNYDGADILQDRERQTFIRVSEHPELKKYAGEDIIVSDGTSVLGADNKAAMTIVMCALGILSVDKSIPHGDIFVAFTPDEEIGLRGAKALEMERFPVDYGYTIDCCERGEVAYRTFNAASAVIRIRGVSAHPMSAKNVMVNAVTVGTDIISMFDRASVPEHTEGTEGFMYVNGFSGNTAGAEISVIIRDHDREAFEQKKSYLEECVKAVSMKYPSAGLSLEISDTYGNIEDALSEKDRSPVEDIFRAMKELDIEPKDIAMRGGTDGSYISTLGIPVPNYFTGAHNFHSLAEFLPIGSMEDSLRVTMKLIGYASEKRR